MAHTAHIPSKVEMFGKDNEVSAITIGNICAMHGISFDEFMSRKLEFLSSIHDKTFTFEVECLKVVKLDDVLGLLYDADGYKVVLKFDHNYPEVKQGDKIHVVYSVSYLNKVLKIEIVCVKVQTDLSKLFK